VAGGLSFKAISLGWNEVCAVTMAGDAYCWGEIDFGSLSFHAAKSPERVPGDVKFDTISVGNSAACGITNDRRTMCWGTNDVGHFGNGSSGPAASLPTAVVSPVEFKSIAVGGWDIGGVNAVRSSFACGVAVTGIAYCWGSDNLGQLGSGAATPTAERISPFPVAGDRTFAALAGIGFATTCGLGTTGGAVCWGSNANGEFGTDTAQAGAFPPTPVATNLRFVALSSRHATCGITTTRDTYCWGSAFIAPTASVTPTLITSIPFVSIAAGVDHACGLTADGTAYCWGHNSSGQLGDGTTNRNGVPVRVATDLRFVRIAAGHDETCALTATGAAYCWGSDGFYSSMLGRGT
jgi:alpha-tubulin suppressor-like RCC1 family protein